MLNYFNVQSPPLLCTRLRFDNWRLPMTTNGYNAPLNQDGRLSFLSTASKSLPLDVSNLCSIYAMRVCSVKRFDAQNSKYKNKGCGSRKERNSETMQISQEGLRLIAQCSDVNEMYQFLIRSLTALQPRSKSLMNSPTYIFLVCRCT